MTWFCVVSFVVAARRLCFSTSERRMNGGPLFKCFLASPPLYQTHHREGCMTRRHRDDRNTGGGGLCRRGGAVESIVSPVVE
ncbi:hypothetical protein BDQ94DRAFT_31258 [Aspergillus welwitschiae]|uniref:Secreted protein n=2 Tax=Aspergillus TaxID=5052 RepID=A0A3F3Q3I9_9EURO|nr:hypothetical protein BDQ94DRAFT_31258 [Aspergillus welwitschiae]RDH33587.1 hypothetical protein BDQ94DRAFT_31258 [Aspergillus welwitschiae]RDK39403.1 hypothetical protein M752DRAFT_56319 [Aspergillus phoenicis ATCC 13157]